MELLFLPIAILVFLAPPFLSGFFAKSTGRSFKLWFVIGCFLPLVANLILFFLPDKSNVSRIEIGHALISKS